VQISARNVLKGKVKKVTPGAVNSEIIVEIAGGAAGNIVNDNSLKVVLLYMPLEILLSYN
jgi:molybdopterin-binding protein